jgi:hypothetical protein
MKKYEITLIGTYINKIIEANTAAEAKAIFKAQLQAAKGCPTVIRLKSEELQGFFA